jgi:hypothetical protein
LVSPKILPLLTSGFAAFRHFCGSSFWLNRKTQLTTIKNKKSKNQKMSSLSMPSQPPCVLACSKMF